MYEKQTWTTGEVITQEKLNHMEEGIASGGTLVVHETVENNIHTLDKTWKEIKDAVMAGAIVVVPIFFEEEVEGVTVIRYECYFVTIVGCDPRAEAPYFVTGNGFEYFANNENDYPLFNWEDYQDQNPAVIV